MSPANFGVRLAALVWVVVSLAVVLLVAAGALVVAGSDPYSATVWGLYVAALLAVPMLGASAVIGLAGAAWARSASTRTRSTPGSTQPECRPKRERL